MKYLAIFDDGFREDLRYWIRAEPRTALCVLQLVEDTPRDPRNGIGKPGRLRYAEGLWSRRVTQEHRLLYSVSDDDVVFIQCRYHY